MGWIKTDDNGQPIEGKPTILREISQQPEHETKNDRERLEAEMWDKGPNPGDRPPTDYNLDGAGMWSGGTTYSNPRK